MKQCIKWGACLLVMVGLVGCGPKEQTVPNASEELQEVGASEMASASDFASESLSEAEAAAESQVPEKMAELSETAKETWRTMLRDVRDLEQGTVGAGLKMAEQAGEWINQAIEGLPSMEELSQLVSEETASWDAQMKSHFSANFEEMQAFVTRVIDGEKSVLAVLQDAGVQCKDSMVSSELWGRMVEAVRGAIQ